ncbi:hypothetical protein DDB_G0273271 [Dictyostelium discoideum AX4]|uniref:Uncharacterized protein n=1 Tax=Dictyostelium discoideum TaxID=44689 RepID=Q556R3_DICDI|nr:hypothetical protein DDB_G0273883 [Dictyostelium discoideum AX4]XP_644693.1 hypothetical protein DDB_G0273271 [Dictyostelium discoideum AX4]EAL70632.1 hypothetical protein DDB_G0273883 [Dictyostelium discoideum AX4]EAL70853.1 hypothetical protein DDB_G0273271 [Dictyostelium discoideum AX4]|eukprot:XP_644558.1 hypothetical protein DDB_G0273883 [Dictyostelium discoideum AX4]
MIKEEDEQLIKKEVKSISIEDDLYDEDSYCLDCGQFKTHYSRHCSSIHQQVNVNKVIMDHCKRYPRESFRARDAEWDRTRKIVEKQLRQELRCTDNRESINRTASIKRRLEKFKYVASSIPILKN